jgi:glycosyltransferase involved in cell wall biosynthesis
VISSGFSLYSIYARFWLKTPQGFTALILAITFLSGINLFFLGIIGEYVGRIYEEAKGRPHYVVRKLIADGAIQCGEAQGRAQKADVTARKSTPR